MDGGNQGTRVGLTWERVADEETLASYGISADVTRFANPRRDRARTRSKSSQPVAGESSQATDVIALRHDCFRKLLIKRWQKLRPVGTAKPSPAPRVRIRASDRSVQTEARDMHRLAEARSLPGIRHGDGIDLALACAYGELLSNLVCGRLVMRLPCFPRRPRRQPQHCSAHVSIL